LYQDAEKKPQRREDPYRLRHLTDLAVKDIHARLLEILDLENIETKN
jgi:hypothetical protein